MKHKNKWFLSFLAVILIMTGCVRQPQGNEAESESPQSEAVSSQSEAVSPQAETVSSQPEAEQPPTVLGEMAKLSPEDGNWMNLSKEQMMEDAEYLHRVLLENFPYYNVIQRKIGIDMEAEYAACLNEIEAAQTDAQFYVALSHWIDKADNLGHLMLIQPGMHADLAPIYKEAAAEQADIYGMNVQWLADVYNNENTTASYAGLSKVMEPLFDLVNTYYEEQESSEEGTGGLETEWQNIETKILEPDKIAYIAINSFDSESYDEDKQLLFDFYAKVRDYDHIIFDFRENGGGSMYYFSDLVVAPNMDKPLEAASYSFLMDGEENTSFFDTSLWKPISSAPDLPRMNQEDFKNFDFYSAEPFIIEPEGNKQLNGRLWMLVGPNVFSSSEYAAMFCKTTGLMTLVGTTTGGDGIGSEPMAVALPNSGLVVRYSAVYGTTADGAGSQEWGTEPDIVSPEGEDALTTCLNAIREAEGLE